MRKQLPYGRLLLLLFLCALCFPHSALAQGDGPKVVASQSLASAAQIVEFSGAPGGICVVIGADDPQLALTLAKQGSFTVHSLFADRDGCESARRAIRARGMYGTVSADVWHGGELPYADNVINIVVVDNYPPPAGKGLPPKEILRVLAPLGTAWLGAPVNLAKTPGWVNFVNGRLNACGIEKTKVATESGRTRIAFRKPWPETIDEWTHYLHGPDGNPVAQDVVVGPPKHLQWTAGPRWLRSHETDSSVSTLVTARGRLFAIVDEGPISLAGPHSPPDKWFLVARDAFNGVLLWKVPIRRWGWREWKGSWFNTRPGDIPLNIQKRLVAVDDEVYVTLGYQAPVCQLDARTGEILQTYNGTERTGEILYLDGTLILSVLDDKQVKLMAVDAQSGKQKWVSDKRYRGSTVDYIKWKEMHGGTEPPELDPSLNIATDGRVVALLDGPDIVCLDYADGTEKWRAPFPLDTADLNAGGIRTQGNLWIGTMIVHDGVVLHASPSRLAAFDADSGKILWQKPKRYIGHLWYEWKDVFVIDGLAWTWSEQLERDVFEISRNRKQNTLAPKSVNGYDLHTGKLVKEVPLGRIFKTHHHHRCYRNKATSRYILASRRGTEFVDLVDGKHTVHNWTRGTCHVGMMPAGGLQYTPPHPCQCYVDEKLNGLNALAPERQRAENQERRAGDDHRLQKGSAYREVGSRRSEVGIEDAEKDERDILHSALRTPRSSDWPAFRHDALRTGAVDTQVPDDLATLWRAKVGRRISPPTVVGGLLFAGLVDEHHVVCLDAGDGSRQWEFATGGRIDSPPTYHQGTVLFGSADGWVYCVRASDGQLAWRFRAAPEQRLMAAFGQLESAWPVHGSVLVQNDVVYFAAGRTSQLDGGIHLYGLDPATGKLLHHRNLAGPDYAMAPDGRLVAHPEGSAKSDATDGAFDLNFQLPMGSLPDVLMGDGEKIYMRSLAFDAQLNTQPGGPDLGAPDGLLGDSYFKRMPWRFGGDYARLIVHDKRSVYYVRMFDTLRGLDPTVYFTPGRKGYLLFAKHVGGGPGMWSERVPVRIRAMVLTANRLLVAGPPDVVDAKDPLGAFEGRQGGLLFSIDSTSGKKVVQRELPSPPVFNGAAAAHGRLYVTTEDGTVMCFGRR